jgi:type II secretory pathway component GspD/PulD (secretin)
MKQPLSLCNVAGIAFAVLPLTLFAQDKPAEKPDTPPAAEHRSSNPPDPRITDCRRQPTRMQASDCMTIHAQSYTYYLQNVSQQNDANEILVAIRNMFDPSLKVFLVANQNAIAFSTYPEEYARIEAFIKTLDRPKKSFRVTYTITDVDGDKRTGTQHFSMVLADGQRSTLKQGTKVPVATGKNDDGKGTPGSVLTNFTYLDVGINIDCTLTAYASGVRLKAKVEQSSVAPEPAVIAGVAEPIIRQSVLDGIADVPSGKPVVLGSVDIAGTTHHLDVAVSVEPIS